MYMLYIGNFYVVICYHSIFHTYLFFFNLTEMPNDEAKLEHLPGKKIFELLIMLYCPY